MPGGKDTTILYLLAPTCAVLNLAAGSIVYLLKLPIYLDQTGTILLALLIGRAELRTFLYAAAAGVLSFIIGGALYKPVLPWFSGTAVAVAAVATFLVVPLLNRYENRPRSAGYVATVIFCGVVLGVVANLVSLPIFVYLFGGVTGSGSTFVVAYLQAAGAHLLSAAFWTGLVIEPIDKTLQLVISLGLLAATPPELIARARA
jgi:energy-coupling factor transport system substrate-specific component